MGDGKGTCLASGSRIIGSHSNGVVNSLSRALSSQSTNSSLVSGVPTSTLRKWPPPPPSLSSLSSLSFNGVLTLLWRFGMHADGREAASKHAGGFAK